MSNRGLLTKSKSFKDILMSQPESIILYESQSPLSNIRNSPLMRISKKRLEIREFKPKEGFNVFLLWQKRLRFENSNLDDDEIQKILSKEWRLLSMEEKNNYAGLKRLLTP